MAKDKITLLLDSGAFSAWKRNSSVDLKAYIKFIKQYEDRLFASVALDVIPGSPSAPRSDPEGAAKASDYNLQKMLDAGVRPMPVYHQFEDMKWLVKMLEDGHEYIGISPSDRQPTNRRMQWLDDVYTMLCDSKGRPYVKTHGFGVTSTDILNEYPFYTADSTTWLILSGYGRMQIPSLYFRDGKVQRDWSKQVMLTVSPKSSKSKSPRQLKLMSDQMKVVLEYLDDIGLSQADIENSYESRCKMGIRVFEDMVAQLGKEPVKFERFKSWLSKFRPDQPDVQLKALRPFRMKLFYVAWANKAHDMLRINGMTNRLLSYYHIKDWTPEDIDSFMSTGLIKGEYISRKANGKSIVPSSTKVRSPGLRTRRLTPSTGTPVVRSNTRERF